VSEVYSSQAIFLAVMKCRRIDEGGGKKKEKKKKKGGVGEFEVRFLNLLAMSFGLH